jgi:hypothetical protein
MFDLIAIVASTLSEAIAATGVSRWRGDDRDRDPAVPLFMLHARLLEMFQTGHKLFGSLHADVGNHRSQSVTTGPVQPVGAHRLRIRQGAGSRW